MSKFILLSTYQRTKMNYAQCPECESKDIEVTSTSKIDETFFSDNEVNYCSWIEHAKCNFCNHTWMVITRWLKNSTSRRIRREVEIREFPDLRKLLAQRVVQ
jgi:hypothetical protein